MLIMSAWTVFGEGAFRPSCLRVLGKSSGARPCWQANLFEL